MADKKEIDRLTNDIKKANSAPALERARLEYVRLLEQDDWEVTARALEDSVPILRSLDIYPSQCAVAEKILELLKSGHPIKAIGMGEPQGVHGIAHVMKGALLPNLYIKILIERRKVWVVSFHQ